ncbi:AEC family transporter [Propionibacteriaceae bacterium Y1923]|uniref:AEC family transporter n=1 Tax=Aestuariimicrobium sp. Y1814 TaxID=3418742 RepID=UPI003C198004
MTGVLSGFATIWVVIGAGWLAAHLRILTLTAQDVLAKVAFFIASPALLFLMVAEADVGRVFSGNLVVTVLATLIACGLYLLIARLWLRPTRSELVVGAMGASYVNAANLGIPIAVFVLNDVTWLAPLLLFQVAIVQPIALSVLDLDQAKDEGRQVSWLGNLTLPLRNPMTIGTLAGLAVNLLGWTLPAWLTSPVSLLADMSVPAMLVAFGISLRLGPLPGRGGVGRPTALASVIKLVVHPLVAWLLAHLLGLDATTTLAVVVIAGLPTAQNVFVWAARYGRALALARDVVFITTVSSILTIGVIAALVHG